MSSRRDDRPRAGHEYSVAIDTLANGGRGVGRLATPGGGDGMTVFVRGGIPGDRARVRIDRVRRRHAEGTAVAIEQAGPDRTDPACAHYAEGCGGCSWQHLGYAAQLAAKERLVAESLHRIGEFADAPVAPIVAAEAPWFYRNKMEFSFHARDGLGLHVGGDWRRVVPVTECRLQSDLAMRIVDFSRDFAARHRLASWDAERNEGFLRQLVIRHGRGVRAQASVDTEPCSTSGAERRTADDGTTAGAPGVGAETMVGLITERGTFDAAAEFAEGIAALHPSIVSVVRGIRGSFDEGSPIETVETLHGRDTIRERVAGLSFEIGLQTFFQTSTRQAEHMLAMVREEVAAGFAATEPDRPTRLLDVFCGVGFFTLGLADLAGEAIGVEIVEPSIVAAHRNAEVNGIDHCTFYAGDARRTLPLVIEDHGRPDVAVIDPPRSGAGGKVMRRLARAQPARIVYVSCNPATLARDLRELEPFGYRLTTVRPIDLFPQTYHVETIVSMDRVAEPVAR